MTQMTRPLTDAEINHLRKLIGWVECEIGQAPEEMVEMLKGLAPSIGPHVDDESALRLKAAYDKSAAVPKYVRQAVKALRKTIVKQAGEVVDVDSTSVRTVREIEQ